MSLNVSEALFVFLWSSSVKELSAHPSYYRPTLIIIDQSCSNFLSNAFKYDLDYPDVLSHLIPSQMKIKGIQIKLHLQESSLNFLIPFSKILIIYQWNGKKIFHWGKWNEPSGNSVHFRMFGQKNQKIRVSSLYILVALVNELKRLKRHFSCFPLFFQDFVDNSWMGDTCFSWWKFKVT